MGGADAAADGDADGILILTPMPMLTPYSFISASARELGQYAGLMAGIIEGILKACQFVSHGLGLGSELVLLLGLRSGLGSGSW